MAQRVYQLEGLGKKGNDGVAVAAEVVYAIDRFKGRHEPHIAERVVTREELLALDGGAEALAAWEAGDDTAYQADFDRDSLAAHAEHLYAMAERHEAAAIGFLERHGEELDALVRADLDQSRGVGTWNEGMRGWLDRLAAASVPGAQDLVDQGYPEEAVRAFLRDCPVSMEH